MQTNSNYTFEVSLSIDSFIDKKISGAMIGSTKNEDNRRIRKEYNFKSNRGIGFKRTSVTSQQLLNSLLDGKVFCHLFNTPATRKDNTFSTSQKKDKNFAGSYVIGVDIDHTNYSSAEEFVSNLSLQPTFYYTSYSNMQNNEARFRLIYVFNNIISNPYFFRYCAKKLNRIIERDTNEIITDDCNLRCSQYFNGTNKNNKDITLSYNISNVIYSLEDIKATQADYINFLCRYADYKSVTKSRTEEINYLLNKLTNKDYIFNKSIKEFQQIDNIEIRSTSSITTLNVEMEKEDSYIFNVDYTVSNPDYSVNTNIILSDWSRLDEDEFKHTFEWENARKNTKYIYRVEKSDWINNLYQYVDDDFFSMFYYVNTVTDGNKRRKSLYQRMCLRRVINPDITKDEMVVNTIIDIMRFFDNSDNLLNSEFIKKNVDAAFDLEIDDIENQYKDSINYLKQNTKPKRGVIYINKQAHSKETTYLILDDIYNSNISVSENLYFINNILKYKISKSTLYDYLKTNNLKTDYYKLSDDEVIELLDINLSVRKNLQILKDNDIKINKDRVSKLLKIKIQRLNL